MIEPIVNFNIENVVIRLSLLAIDVTDDAFDYQGETCTRVRKLLGSGKLIIWNGLWSTVWK